MNALEQFKASNAWDSRYNLPLCPGMNNPWIYMAYAQMLFEMLKDGSDISRNDIVNHFYACERAISGKIQEGLFLRWPDGSGGNNSHDEIMGAAYLDRGIADDILEYLDGTDGLFNPAGEPLEKILQCNVYRFVFLRPFLVACSGRTPSFFSQVIWSASLLIDLCTRGKGDAGGTLKDALMARKMEKYPICMAAILIFRFVSNRRGMTPKYCLTIEPKEKPIYGQLAPDAW